MTREQLLWWHLNVLNAKRYDAIVEVYGSLDDAVKHVSEELLRGLGCKDETVREALMRMEEFDEEAERSLLEAQGIAVVMIDDPRYPEALRQIPDPPVFLSYRGDFSVLDQPCIGMVGTRKMTAYGRRVAEDFTDGFVRAGMVTVSGLAHGIDSAVALETLKRGGKTVAVLGGGLAAIAPAEKRKLADRIVQNDGLLLSEYPPQFEPLTFTFPARNRIIAALSLATVVLEAPTDSGALITADLAQGYFKQVFAVPGSVYDENFAGNHALIAKNVAKLVSVPDDVLKELGVVAPAADRAPAYTPQDALEAAVLKVLSTLPQPVDDVVERSGLPPADVGATLTLLELAGAAKNTGGGQWVRT